IASAHSKNTHGAQASIDHVQMLAIWRQARIKRAQAGWIPKGRAAEQCELAVVMDEVARDRRASGVDGEEIAAIVGDLDPARRGLIIRVGRAPKRCQASIARDLEGRDGSAIRWAMRVRDVELRRVRWAELAAKRARALRRERRAR